MIAGQVAKLRQRRTAPLILELDLSDGLAEERPADPVSAVLARHRLVLADVLDGLRRARNDQRVKALVAKVGGRPIGLATVQELGHAIEEFRDAGKLTVAWAESFGEFSARERALLPCHRLRDRSTCSHPVISGSPGSRWNAGSTGARWTGSGSSSR